MVDTGQNQSTFGTSAYGGGAWSPRSSSLREELGSIWAECGVDSEWRELRSVVLHRPDIELEASSDPQAVQMLAPVDTGKARAEHDEMAAAFAEHGVQVVYVEPDGAVLPNQMFCADLMFSTPEGVILARPASTVRAGEERQLARRLADHGVPIVRSVSGNGTFEGADAAWIDPTTVVIGRGLRTNQVGIDQVGDTLAAMGVDAFAVDLPFGTMHLMGMLRIVDADLAVAFPRRTPHAAVVALRDRGVEVVFVPEGAEQDMNRALNFVTLGPRQVLMNGDYDEYRAFFEGAGIECVPVVATELVKGAGGFGCLTGVLTRRSS